MGLRKFSTTFLISKSANDERQIPAESATVEVYRQGAKVASNATVLVASATTVNVRSTGGIVVADTVQAGTDTTEQMTVTEVTSATALKLQAIGISNINLLANERLVVVSAPLPVLYNNDAELGTPLTNPATADSQGYIEFYTPTSPFDLIVRLSGMSPEVYEDMESGTLATSGGGGSSGATDYFNVMDFDSVASALEQVPAGCRLYFPSEEGPFIPPTAAGWTIDKPMELFGDGPDVGEDVGFKYFNSSGAANKDSTLFTIDLAAVRGVTFRNLVMSNAAGMPAVNGTGDAIRVIGSGTLTNLVIENCWILYAGRSGLYINPNTNMVHMSIYKGRFRGMGGHGMFLYNSHMIDIGSSSFTGNGGFGAGLVSSGNGIAIKGTDFENNGIRLASSGGGDTTLPRDINSGYNAQLYLENCNGVSVSGCNIEDTVSQNPTNSKHGITFNATSGSVIGGCTFANAAAVAGTYAIQMAGGAYGNTILSNSISNFAASVSINSFTDEIGNVIFPQGVKVADATAPGIVLLPAGVNRNFIFSTNTVASINDKKGVGLILPMMASADLVASPQEGLLFYENTSDQVRIRKAAATAVVP